MGSRKGNPNPPISAPNDMTMLLAILGIDHEVKRVGDSDRAFYFEVCAANRDIVDRAVDTGALERDCPGLQDLMTLVVSVVHQRDSFDGGNSF
jgi:hypothetical protein